MVPLPWSTRMKIALGAAKGLAFLHEADKPVIYRDFKTSNILLDEEYNAKLSDFGLAKDGPVGKKSHVSTRIMGTYGYAPPEYTMTGIGALGSSRSVSEFKATASAMADEEHPERREEASELAPFDPTKKKKKKKVVIQEPSDEVDKLAEKTETLAVTEPAELNFTGMKKKKKKQVDLDSTIADLADGEDTQDDQAVEEQGEGIELGGGPTYPWEGTDRDYKYEELLDRVFNILRENNPDLAGDRRRTVMRPPQVLREGTKKTVFVNFMDLCKTMHRQPEHVMMFLLAEMGTSGSLDGQQRLVIKGRFAPKNFEAILRRYINEYVICNGCKSPDTILSKENRLFFLRCEQCGSSRSVAPIKAGFVAQVGRRKA